MSKILKSFWITNISKKDITLEDLNCVVRSFTSINLLDSKHYNITEQQIKNSLEAGSLKKKNHLVKPRITAPEKEKPISIITEPTTMPTRAKALIELKSKNFDNELDITDDEFANELADTAEEDRKPRHSR